MATKAEILASIDRMQADLIALRVDIVAGWPEDGPTPGPDPDPDPDPPSPPPPPPDPGPVPETPRPADPRANDMPHGSDPSKMAEHVAFLDLYKYADATHWPRQDGDWSDPQTWSGGRIPDDDARVIIQHPFVIVKDDVSSARIKSVFVDGVLNFTDQQDTLLKVEDFGIGPSGTTAPGGVLNMVNTDDTVRTEVLFIDNGPLDFAADPMLLGRGLISHAVANIQGATKEAWSRLQAAALAGDTSFDVEDASGWLPGDTLVVTEDRLGSFTVTDPVNDIQVTDTREEIVSVIGVSGNTVTFTPALAYDHIGPSGRTCHVGNFTRNIKFSSENPAIERRGHVMFMHSDMVTCDYAEFNDLGRTNKERPAVDASNATSSKSNVKGRYSIHVHRCGFGGANAPSIKGNAIWGSPGWGLTHHDSHAHVRDNVAYNCFGACFVSETGNETGIWDGNLAILSPGMKKTIKEVYGTFDMWKSGSLFACQARGVALLNNVAAGSPNGHGFAFNVRAIPSIVAAFKPLVDLLPVPEIGLGAAKVDPESVPIRIFKNNEAYAVRVGVEVVKGSPFQYHDVRSVFDGLVVWECVTGAHVQYTGHYTIINSIFESVATVPSNISSRNHTGVFIDQNTFDQAFNNVDVRGFSKGVHMKRTWGNPFPTDLNPDHYFAFVDVRFENCAKNYVNLRPEDIVIDSSALPLVPANKQGYESTFSNAPDYHLYDSHRRQYLTARVTDSLGTRVLGAKGSPDEFRFQLNNLKSLMARDGVWEHPNDSNRFFLRIPAPYTKDRLTGETAIEDVIIEVANNYRPQDHTINGKLN